MTRESPSEYASLAQLTGQLDVFQVGGVEGHSTPPKNTGQARLGDSPPPFWNKAGASTMGRAIAS